MSALVLSPGAASANSIPVSLPAAPPQQSASAAPVDIGNPDELRVEVQEVSGEVSAAKGAILHKGDAIKTEEGSCRLLIDGKAKVLLTPHTTLKITEALRDSQAKTESTSLTLDSGNLKIELPKLRKGSRFEVITPTAIAAVRGTIFYVQTGTTQGQASTRLYVDESKGGVDFTNIFSHQLLNVPAFSLSNALANGQLDKPVQLTDEQKEAFFESWKQLFGSSGVSQQFGVEEIPAVPPLPPAGLPDPNLPDFNDAKQDQLTEQNIPGANGFTPPAETSQTNQTEEPVPPGPTQEELLAQQERDMIRAEIADLLGDQDFDNADANLARASDAQTGKVFTDVHGNRVRVDQYIFESVVLPDPQTDDEPFSQISFLSLTARTGSYQNGVSSAMFTTAFNRVLTEADGPIKDLPWDDYLRVVKRDELTGTNFAFDFEQFIVHERQGDSENGPDLYPQMFKLAFEGPAPQPGPGAAQGSLLFTENYGDPQFVDADQGSFWVQPLLFDTMTLRQTNGDTIISQFSPFTNPSTIASLNGDFNITFTDEGGVQTAGLPGDPRLAQLMTDAGINAFRNGGGAHPSYLEHVYAGDRILIGVFFPIDDAGSVLDAPGFNLRGIRDVVSPNPLVNGGNYNLEMLFMYGTGTDTTFNESFRIDVVLDMDIFNGGQGSVSGIRNPYNTMNTSTTFPTTPGTDEEV